jgi:hypothetical protein
MLIANPIYDTVFKYLMEDTEIAKRIIGILIGQDILELEFRATERVHDTGGIPLPLFRMDFLAKVNTPEGPKKVLIEVQKSRRPTDLSRFRSYLGKQYALRGELPVPIITIYFLGYDIDNLPEAVTKVGRTLQGVITGKQFVESNDFVECLTHDSYIVQVKRLKKRLQTPVEKVLSVFDQSYQIEGEKAYFLNYPEGVDEEGLQRILRRLQKIAADQGLREQLETEEEAELEYESLVNEFSQQVEEERRQKEEERRQKEEAIRLLLSAGVSKEEIAERLKMDISLVQKFTN